MTLPTQRTIEHLPAGDATGFELTLPGWLARRPLLRYLGRDPRSPSERVDGGRFVFTFAAGGRPAVARVELGRRRARCRLEAPAALPAGAARVAHRLLWRQLGLHLDPRPFERRVADDPAHAPLVAGRRGLTVPQTRDVFDALLWVVAGQQVSLPVAFALRRRLTRLAGTRVDDGLWVPPTAAAVAALEPSDLRRLGFSRRKGEVIVDLARAVVAGELDVDADDRDPDEVERTFGAVRGLGPWSVGYLMMRAFGFADCVPLGDAALARKLQHFFALDHRPAPDQTRTLMRPFAPHRSLATFYFWSLPESSSRS